MYNTPFHLSFANDKLVESFENIEKEDAQQRGKPEIHADFDEENSLGEVAIDEAIEYNPPENTLETLKEEENQVINTYEQQQNLWGTVPWEYDEQSKTIVLYSGDAGSIAETPWKEYTSVETILINERVVLAGSAARLFTGLRNLKSIDQAGNLDTSKVTNMDSMFSNTLSLEEIDVSNWDTSRVTSMIDQTYKSFIYKNSKY
ncbi:BspA family leucine-rich repeat surface protein [Enterococcus faecium]